MATLDGMTLVGASPAVAAGAAFRLKGSALEDMTTSPDPKWTVEVRRGSQYVVARSVTPIATYTQARDEAYAWAQKGLDLVAIKRRGDLSLSDPKNLHITWWAGGSGSVLRITSIEALCFDTKANAVVMGKDGNPAAQPPAPQTPWHESLRYFRLSQTTDDLFDAYRNLYLALESILDHIEPQILKTPAGGGQPKPAEGEGQWLNRALKTADRLVGMARFAPPGVPDPVKAVFNEVYAAERTGVFHAKGSRAHHLPHGTAEFPTVREAYARMNRLFLALTEKSLGISYGSGGMTYEGFKRMMDGLAPHLVISVADRRLAADTTTANVELIGAAVLDLPTASEPTLDGPFLKSFIGTAVAADLSALPMIGSILTRHKGNLVSLSTLECTLTIGGSATVEAHVGIRLRNARDVKDFFGT